MAAPDAFSFAEGAVFHDTFEIVRRIDSGAMGTVYEVVDRRTRRRRALKIMLARFADNPEVTERFRREATITADVVSEHVVETYDAGVDEASGLPFIVMELLRGEDLGKILSRGPLPPADVVTLLMQTASALDKMHAAGVIHRDLKPENLFLTRRDDGAPRLKVLDFGIAKVIEKSAPTATTTRNLGTPVYMSPEQVTGAGPAGPSTDLYAVGQLAYTMLAGEAYWLHEALAHETVYPLLLRIMEGVQEPATERAARTKGLALPAAFDAWFAKATALAPEDRFPTATDSILALAAALDVPRPVLPSWTIDPGIATAPTLHPPAGDDDDEEPILLVPTPRAAPVEPPRAREAHRTLSPVSTLPDEAPAPPSAPDRRQHRRLFGIGAAFFATGVLVAILFARRGPAEHTATPPERQRALASHPAEPSAATSAEPPAPPPATAVSSAPEPVTSSSAAEPVAPEAPSAAPTSSSAAARPTAFPRRPSKPAPKSSAPPRPTRPYGDPSRDL